MAICPECKKDIDYLKNYQSGEKYYWLTVGKNGSEYEDRGFDADCGTNDFECPECSEVLFTDETKAVRFLRGKKKPKSK